MLRLLISSSVTDLQKWEAPKPSSLMGKLRCRKRGDEAIQLGVWLRPEASSPGNRPVRLPNLTLGHMSSPLSEGQTCTVPSMHPENLGGEIKQLRKLSRRKWGWGRVGISTLGSILHTKVNENTAKQTRSPSVISDYETKGLRPGSLAQWLDRKPFVTKAALFKIEGRMLGKCDGLGCSYSPRPPAHCPEEMDLPRGRRGGNQARQLSGWHHQAEHWVTTNGDLLGQRRGKHPLKPSKCISFRDSERGRERERARKNPDCSAGLVC